jgi:TraM recognition site of TraD and TraG
VSGLCGRCGVELTEEFSSCPLCAGRWEIWELVLPPIPLEGMREQVAAWLSQLPTPAALELLVTSGGLRTRLLTPPGKAQGALSAWAAMTRQQSRWERAEEEPFTGREPAAGLYSPLPLPNLIAGGGLADPALAIAGQLIGSLPPGGRASLRVWLLGHEQDLQEKLCAFIAYSDDTAWSLRLGLLHSLALAGGLTALAFGGALGGGWLPPALAAAGILAGGALTLAGVQGLLDWMAWRAVPREIMVKRVSETLLRVSFAVSGTAPRHLSLLAGRSAWRKLDGEWPQVRRFGLPLPVSELAGLLAPPQVGEGSGMLDRATVQSVPAPPPSRPLTQADFKIGLSPSTGEAIGIDPDGHGMAVCGSRSGKSSVMAGLLEQLIARGRQAPGIFLVDPHCSLADSFLQAVDELPPDLRAEAVRRLRIITPDQPEVIPLNLLAIRDYAWAGNTIVQVGRRLWDDYWGPRMQAALLALFRLVHAWNMNHPDGRMGLIHVIFAAFNAEWRHDAMQYLPPAERMESLALDALLGQFGNEGRRWDQGWLTEVISPVLSKVMALHLTDWVSTALHQGSFVDMEQWIRDGAWVVLRLPSGTMGRESARLMAGIVYNVFDAAYRRATALRPIPYTFVIDEAQEIGAGLQLESMLSEGGKFGARMFVLSQSLAMMRSEPALRPLAQSLLANTSTQAFFSPDPEDAALIRETLSAEARYGLTTLDLPTLTCWLRTRLNSEWQPPTLLKVRPLRTPDPLRVHALVREVIGAHPEDYLDGEPGRAQAVEALKGMVPPMQKAILSELFRGTPKDDEPIEGPEDGGKVGHVAPDDRRLGF